ncbi:rhodanese-like domain-containing protein [Mangrovivirga sp. M17]|uniref:Rhodanese-like domain-containing protein n=1 Tax=Mangrovivirga halotolerans TaxID=2993936 RepID=A0ABT3RY49_9BACT|nr:rhodanese-like domain-containing protein [Mangrovivirga halotolerans]MCX2746065.1 rhodanese-like domain-containing protein [Mangrovivirga halotolerans]
MKLNRNIVLVLILVVITLNSCGGQTSEEGDYSKVSPEKFKELVSKEDVQLVDVRTMEEYRNGHIKGAILADYLSGEFSDYKPKLDRQKTVYVYCAVGGRSKRAAEDLERSGYTVVELEGGIRNWTSKGLELEK